jgi:hypothetical protein
MVTINGVVRLSDMEDYLEKVMSPATMSYHKLVDLTDSSLSLSQQDLAVLAECVRDYASSGPMGALAVVVASDETEQQIRQFGSLSGAERPWKIFRMSQPARDWLASQPMVAPRDWLERRA